LPGLNCLRAGNAKSATVPFRAPQPVHLRAQPMCEYLHPSSRRSLSR
jgi:hypothetical protein